MSKIMDYLLEEAEQKFDGDFEAAQEHWEKEKELAHLKWENEQNEKRIRELEVELGEKEPVEKFDFLASFPQTKENIPQKYIDDPDRAYEEWIDAKVERGEY